MELWTMNFFGLSLSTKILIGMFLGIAAGLLFGESCESLGVIGDAFIKLLQMTILPYIMSSLIYGIGSLDGNLAKKLAVRGIFVMILIWIITLCIIFFLAEFFPSWQSGAFYSPSIIETHAAPNYLDIYIPANPFNSLANNIVPAIVFFSLAVGVARIGIEDKTALLNDFKVFAEALTRLSKTIIGFTPLGVFGITASAAGTITLEEITLLQVYFISYALGSIALAIFIFPLLITVVTPFKYTELLKVSKDTIVNSFTTANLFVALPLITEACKELMSKYPMADESGKHIDVIIPISFNFPNAGKIITLLFILFAGWYTGDTFDGRLNLAFSGILSFFGNLNTAIPYLLQSMYIQPDTYELYLVSGVLNGKFATMLAAISLFTLTLITCYTTLFPPAFNMKRSIIALGGIGLSCLVISELLHFVP